MIERAVFLKDKGCFFKNVVDSIAPEAHIPIEEFMFKD